MAKELSQAQCILLTVHYASSANIAALYSFTPTRADALDPELILRILLTYLPESTEPKEYTSYVEEVASRLYLDYEREEIDVDIRPVQSLTEEQARKQVRKLHLEELQAPSFPPHAPTDLLTRFLCHRAYRIDQQTGLLRLVPQLVEPFAGRNDFLRTWYISVVLPVLRLETEFYADDASAPQIALSDFEKLDGKQGLNFLLKKGEEEDGKVPVGAPTHQKRATIARDVKSLVGPWMYGHTERKRRKLGRHHGEGQDDDDDTNGLSDMERRMRKISLTGVSASDKTGHDWEYMFQWMVTHAQRNLPCVTHCIEDWDGPSDVDFGGFDKDTKDYLDDEVLRKLELQYAQAAFATCYAAQIDTEESIHGAHGILARLAELLDFVPPPDLASSIESLPKVERHMTQLDTSKGIRDLEPQALLTPEHPLTTPRLETYMLLQMMVYSAYQLSGLGHPLSLVNVAKLHFYSSGEEQLGVLREILRNMSANPGKKDTTQWTSDRAKLIWLWNWGIEAEEGEAQHGAGALGKIDKGDFEEEMLKVFLGTSCYDLAIKLYVPSSTADDEALLPRERVERVVLAKIMEEFDGASNGNKMRGGVRRANETIAAFRPHFPNSVRFRQASALISATHALSFYALTLQHGVPFQPVSIRVSSDPISLVDKVLEQNPRAYTKLDDLVDIAQNLVSAGLPQVEESEGLGEAEHPAKRLKLAERRVVFMAVGAALREEDFETAYSYVVNRSTPSGADMAPSPLTTTAENNRTISKTINEHADDISWRAAFLAGRYRPASATPPTLRRLEQRTELLSLALLLAPTSALTEILAVWRRCEEETTALQLAQQAEEEDFDDRADKRIPVSALPGNFTFGGDEQPGLLVGQKRREMGRIGASPALSSASKVGEGEAPMSMFDLTRSAASAFSRNAFPLRGAASAKSEDGGMERSGEGLAGEVGGERVRRRDLVASAVSGGLASGLGWVLGAAPGEQQQQQQQR
ncbi:hypothetical protein LTR08_004473 [Meristemomyces frigidus]|nr:hypothetical protein LTR08_004473 [Meristemomyces frigidus]